MAKAEQMDELELASVVAAELQDAQSFIDDDIGPLRSQALDYYFGRPFGDEEDGRSQVVSRDVHDMVSAALPSLMRIFFGPEHVVEFEPYGPEDVDEAGQKTDYVNYIVTTDNDGFEVFYAAIKNALREKVGFVKYWWDEAEEVSTRTYTGLDQNALTALLEDLRGASDAEIIEATEDEAGISVKLSLKKRRDRVCIAAVPPEEFLISRDARTIDDARLVAHRTMKPLSDLIAMGYEREEIDSIAADLDWNEERLGRNEFIQEGAEAADPSMREVLYVESYVRVDYDGDGIAELRKVCTVGAGFKVIHNEPADERPFADFHCDPEPHTFFGESIADKTMDVQRIKSNLLRRSLDSLAQSIYPRTVVVDGDGNIEDALNTEVGAILRARTASGYTNLVTPFVGREAFPMLTYMDELRENRTGMSKVSMGLDAEALQNTTATAAEGQFSRSQERIELIARIMASGMRKLFRGVAKLVTENQRSERMIKLRNKWVPVDPRAWCSEMNVICNVGLGGGSQDQKVNVLRLIAEKQEQVMLTAGPNNPLVTLKQLHTTYSKLVQEAGFKNPDAFFSDPDSEEVQQRMAQQPEPPPDPKLIEAQAKMQLEAQQMQASAEANRMKAEIDLRLAQEKHQAELQMQRERMQLEDQFRREQGAAELQLKREEMQLEAQIKLETARIGAEASSKVNGPSMGGKPG